MCQRGGNKFCADTLETPLLLVYAEDDPVDPGDGMFHAGWIECSTECPGIFVGMSNGMFDPVDSGLPSD